MYPKFDYFLVHNSVEDAANVVTKADGDGVAGKEEEELADPPIMSRVTCPATGVSNRGPDWAGPEQAQHQLSRAF